MRRHSSMRTRTIRKHRSIRSRNNRDCHSSTVRSL
jgi:hypothetical protein